MRFSRKWKAHFLFGIEVLLNLFYFVTSRRIDKKRLPITETSLLHILIIIIWIEEMIVWKTGNMYFSNLIIHTFFKIF